MKKIFILDWDDSLRNGYSALDWVEYLNDQQLFTKTAYEQFLTIVAAYREDDMPYEQFVKQYSTVYIQGIQPFSALTLDQHAKLFAMSEMSKVSNFTYDLLYFLKKNAFDILILSGSPKIVLNHFFSRYHPINIIGLEPNQRQHRLDQGEDEVLPVGGIAYKQHIFEQIRHQYDFVGVVGDSESDLPLILSSDAGILVGEKIEIDAPYVLKVDHQSSFELIEAFIGDQLAVK